MDFRPGHGLPKVVRAPSLLTDQSENMGCRVGDLNCKDHWEEIQKLDSEKQALGGNEISTADWDVKKGQVVVRVRMEKHGSKKRGWTVVSLWTRETF